MRLRRVLDYAPARAALPLRAALGHRDAEIAHLRSFVKPGDEVVDVGAHKGAYTWHLARLVGKAGIVHAFEPQPDLAGRLHRAVPRQVVVHECALSDREVDLPLSIPVWGRTRLQGHASLEAGAPGSTDISITVPTRRLDQCGVNPRFCKVDVEGHEVAVLRGAEETVRRCRPVLLLEIDYRHQRQTEARTALLAWLAEHDYVAHYVDGTRLLPAGTLSAATDPNPHLGAAEYVYNWFMLPDSGSAPVA